MKIFNLKKQLIPFLHILFWIISYNFWNAVLNPGVESSSVIQGFEVGRDLILLVNSLFLLYCSLPFIWLARKVWLWIKIPVTVLFLMPLGYVIL